MLSGTLAATVRTLLSLTRLKPALLELENAVPRPPSPVYQNISTVLSTTLSPPGAINPQAAADELRASIQDAIDGKGILP